MRVIKQKPSVQTRDLEDNRRRPLPCFHSSNNIYTRHNSHLRVHPSLPFRSYSLISQLYNSSLTPHLIPLIMPKSQGGRASPFSAEQQHIIKSYLDDFSAVVDQYDPNLVLGSHPKITKWKQDTAATIMSNPSFNDTLRDASETDVAGWKAVCFSFSHY